MIEDEHIHARSTMQAELKKRTPSIVPVRSIGQDRARVWNKPSKQAIFINCSTRIATDKAISRFTIIALGTTIKGDWL